MRGRTTILVAHRASTVRLADRVVLLEDGRAVDEGTARRTPRPQRAVPGAARRCRSRRARHPGAADAPPDPDGITGVGLAGAGRAASVAGGEVPIGDRSVRWPGRCGAPARGGNFGANLAATPELLAALARLPDYDDEPDVDDRGRGGRTRRTLLPAAVRAAVAARAAARPRPGRPRCPADRRRADPDPPRHRRRPARDRAACCGSASILFARRRGRRLGGHVGRGVRDRSHRRADPVRLAPADLRPPPAAVARLLRRRDGRAGDDPHDERRRGAVPAGADRPGQRGGRDRHLRRGRRVPRRHCRPPLALATASVLPLLAGLDRAPTSATRRAPTATPAKRSPTSTPTSRRTSPACASPRPTAASERNTEGFRAVSGTYLSARLRAQRLLALYFPGIGLLADLAAVVVLGAGAAFVADGGSPRRS